MKISTRLIAVDPDHPDPASLDEAAQIIIAGGLVAFPTETVYGLGADASNPAAVAHIFAAKGRPANNPLIVHGADIPAVQSAVSSWPQTAEILAREFWPGPLTLVLPRSSSIPDIVTAGQATVGIRIPDSKVAQALLARAGRTLAAPSANRSTRISPTTAAHVLADLDGLVDLILDAGPARVGIESTVLDLTSNPPRLLRPGAVTLTQLSAALGLEVGFASRSTSPSAAQTSPGQLDLHYAPRTPLFIFDPDQLSSAPWPRGQKIALLIAGHSLPPHLGNPVLRVDWLDPSLAARTLYATLHRWDDSDLDAIYVVLPPETDPWRALRDRLSRASRRSTSAE